MATITEEPEDMIMTELDMFTGPDKPVTFSDDPALNAIEEDYDKELTFSSIRSSLNELVTSWNTEIEETETRRKIRKIDLDVEQLRKDQTIDEDETFIPVRVIDTNIQREQPPYINYLRNSRRIAIFKCVDKFGLNTQRLEEEFTAGMTYLNWETPHFKCIDGSQTHGWDSTEIVYDETKPLNVGIEHIGHDKLFFPSTALSIQDSPQLVRRYDITSVRLKAFVKEFGFDVEQVSTILNKYKDSPAKSNDTIVIYKRLFKLDGVVWVAWFSLTDGVSDWLKKPEKLYIGIDEQSETGEWQPADIALYPISLLPYRESEQAELMEYVGRCYLDENRQEACTSMLSAFVNKLNRSARVYGSPAQEEGTGSSLKEITNIKLTNSTILNKPFNFWSLEGPDPLIIKALEYMDTTNAQETNQVNFAAMNRADSRKTAKEIGSAEQQQALLNGVQLTLFSTHIRAIYSFAWLIVQSQALQNKLKLMQKEVQVPILQPMTGQPIVDSATGQPAFKVEMQNNIEVIALQFDVRAAGDIDVIQRQEKIIQMKQDWGVISQTPLAMQFLADLMKLEYPDSGENYAAVIMQTDQMKALQGQVQALSTVLQGVFEQNPEIIQTIPAQQQQQLQQLMASVQQPQQKGN